MSIDRCRWTSLQIQLALRLAPSGGQCGALAPPSVWVAGRPSSTHAAACVAVWRCATGDSAAFELAQPGVHGR